MDTLGILLALVGVLLGPLFVVMLVAVGVEIGVRSAERDKAPIAAAFSGQAGRLVILLSLVPAVVLLLALVLAAI